MDIAVIKIGGSILYDNDLKLNVDFLRKIIHWFKNQDDYASVAFVTGGGRLSRFLLNQVKEDINSDSPKHRVGIKVSRVNAIMFFGLFNDNEVEYFESTSELCASIKKGKKGALIGGVLEGWSTDMVAASIACDLGVKEVKKISNIDYIYSSDPYKYEDSEPFEMLTWEKYIKLFHEQIGYKHKPNMSAPIDIECSLFCKEKDIAFRVSGGELTSDVVDLLNSGTLVSK